MPVFSSNVRLLFIICVVGSFLTACEESPKKEEKPPEICCEASGQTCRDGVLFKCDAASPGAVADGSGVIAGFDLQMTPCPSGACSGNECASKECPGVVGSTRCDADGKVMTCTGSGTEQASSCGKDETCQGGSCLKVPCSEAGATACAGWDLVECSGTGAWEIKERCQDSSLACSTLAGDAACEKPQCSPSERFCYGSKVLTCDQYGWVVSEAACGTGEECRQGHCIPAICGGLPIVADATGSEDIYEPSNDIPPPPEVFTIQDIVRSKPDVKAPSLASAIMDGEEIIFSSYKTAAWISTGTQDNPDQGKALQISMAKGVTKLELLITGMSEEGLVGEWDNQDKSVIQVEVRYSDGLTEAADPQGAGCTTVGWTSCSSTYRVALTAFGGVGQHVKGNFEAILVDGTSFTEGQFDVERIQ